MSQDKEREIQLQFLEEAQDYLNTIDSRLLGISATTEVDNQGMDAVLRAAHSIKGGAAMMGFETLSHLAHRVENFFKVIKIQKHSVDAEVEGLLLAGVDCLRRVVELSYQVPVVDQQWLESNVNPVFERLDELLEPQAEENTVTPLSPVNGQDTVTMIFETEVEECLQRLETILADPERPGLFEEISTMAQDLGGLGEILQVEAFKNLCESINHHLETTPDRVEEIAGLAVQAWRRSQAAVITGQIDTLPAAIDLVNPAEAAEAIPVVPANVAETSITSATGSSLSELKQELAPATDFKENQENTVRVPIKQLEQLNDLFGELTIERNGLDLHLERLRNSVKILERRMRTLQQSYTRQQIEEAFPPEGEGQSRRSPDQSYNSFYRRDQDSNLEGRSQEVMANLVQLQEVTEDIDLSLKDTDQIVSDLNRTAKQLQTCVTQLRMRPFSDLVGRFPRALRELALQYGKNVELKIQGGSTLIDRSILEALNNPLMHLLRNAFDHGIEDPATRRACGKPEQGTIEIKAAYRGNQALITLSDDGGGIDLDKVRVRAQQLGLNAAAIATARDEELLTLIFEPGFSTADQVTALSGRGVGMDVVRTNLRQIRGGIKVDTTLGVGTTFTINVPLTLSVARVLLVESQGMLLAFPTTAIEEILLLNPEQILTSVGEEAIPWKGYRVPLIHLSDWLQFRCPQVTADSEATPLMSVPSVLILAQGNEWVGLQVERCWGEQEVATRPVEGAIAMPPGFTGCTILGDGRVVPLVNAPELLHWIASCQQQRSPNLELEDKYQAAAPQSQNNTILLVDDSINVRRFLSLTLEKAGYRVEQARDGQDALEKLLSGLPITAAICDIDMPRLDGYGFLARVKSNPAFQNLPIVMLTSRSGDRERQLAMNLGATAYFCKPYNKQELLQTLNNLLQN